MTLKECYEKLGGDYDAVFQRLHQDERIQKFMLLFPKDTNYESLCQSLDAQDWTTAFRAAHSLKGICLNLGFTALADASSELTEALRNGAPSEFPTALVEQVRENYETTMNAISEFMNSAQ